MKKRCTACGLLKSHDDFYVSRMGKRGYPILSPDCVGCHLDARRGRPRASRAAYFREYRASRRGRPRRIDTQMLPSGPFAEWLQRIMDRDGIGATALARRLGLPDNLRQYIRGDRQSVTLAVVDRAIINEGTTLLQDVYPELYEDVAA